MPRILLSLALIALVGGSLVFGGTTAFFSDTESSAANVFTAGAIDLQIDNASYYNGVFNEGTSWAMTDLTETEKFFDFADLKPDDYGEDTISIHVDSNDAYLCADVTLTTNDDNGLTEPEVDVDPNGDGAGNGELADLVNFIWWADDGDNVLEDDEHAISNGPLGALALGEVNTIPLADTENNIWTGTAGPIAGGVTKFIGKAWCFGTLGTTTIIAQDGVGDVRTPADDNNGDLVAGTPEDGGYTCDGSTLGNESQTDSLTADISFDAVQARHNPNFTCLGPTGGSVTTLTLVKLVINDDGGTASSSAWTLQADGPTDISGTSGSVSVTNAPVVPGAYTLSELNGPAGYVASQYSCIVNGGAPVVGNAINIAEGESAVCTITNNDENVSCEISEVQTLIPDSGFENPEVTAGAQWDVFNSPAGAWNVLWRDDIPATFGSQNRPNPARLEIHEGVLGAAFEGNQYTELDSDWGGPLDSGNGEPASVTIYQDIPTTPGNTYRIKFAFAPRPNTVAAENKLEVRWGGDPVFDSGNVADPNGGIEWQPMTFDVLATTTTTRLQFTDLGTANSLGTFLDDIKLFGEVCQ